jgi:hypothetical protein
MKRWKALNAAFNALLAQNIHVSYAPMMAYDPDDTSLIGYCYMDAAANTNRRGIQDFEIQFASLDEGYTDVAIGQMIVDALETEEVVVDWDGTAQSNIVVKWKPVALRS